MTKNKGLEMLLMGALGLLGSCVPVEVRRSGNAVPVVKFSANRISVDSFELANASYDPDGYIVNAEYRSSDASLQTHGNRTLAFVPPTGARVYLSVQDNHGAISEAYIELAGRHSDHGHHHHEDRDRVPREIVPLIPRRPAERTPARDDSQIQTSSPHLVVVETAPGTYLFQDVSPQGGTYQWNFGDGQRGMGKQVVHQYNRPGVYRFSVQSESGVKGGSLEFRAR